MVSIKVEGSCKRGADVRRVRLEDLPRETKSDFQTVTAYVTGAFPGISHFVLKYKDDEGDLVTVASEAEFQEGLRVSALAKRCLKLYLVEVPAPKPKKETSLDMADPQIIDPLPIELQFLTRIANVVVSKSTIAIPSLREKVISVFPELKTKEFSLKYLDDEGDAVTMTEADELQDALQLVKDGQAFVLVVSPNAGSVSTTLVSSTESERSQPQKVQKEEERKKKKQWEDITWDDLNETLEKLQKLGFTDTALCTRLLEHHNYDYDAVLRELRLAQDKN
jgi:hypothetical protein